MVALCKDNLICFFEVVKPLICSLQDGKELLVLWVIVLFGTRSLLIVEIDRCWYSETISLVQNAGDWKDAGLSFQNDWLSWLECFGMGALVKAVCYCWNVTSAFCIDSHLTCLDILEISVFFGRSGMGVVTLAFFMMNCWKTSSMEKAHVHPEQTPGLASPQLLICGPISLHSHWGWWKLRESPPPSPRNSTNWLCGRDEMLFVVPVHILPALLASLH